MESEPSPGMQNRRTPADASDFEREQLRFLLSGENLPATLAEINPSLAWLPVLSQLNIVQNERQVIAWVERNLADPEAVQEVVANIHFFGPETASFLEHRLDAQAQTLSPVLLKSWQLVTRHMHTARRGLSRNDWFDIRPRIVRGEHSADLLERIAEVLRPKLRVGKRFLFESQSNAPPARPSDLMSIDYEVEDGILTEDVLAVWPLTASAETDTRLLSHLSAALEATLEDAVDVGLERNDGFSASDSDVPSVAEHSQNAHHSGFAVIVRVMAEIWERLSQKSSDFAVKFVDQWWGSPFKLTRRLALFAASSAAVPHEKAASFLIAMPSEELFLAGSSVEVFRLIRNRWREFSREAQSTIVNRVVDGPPRSAFRDDADTDAAIDRCRFDLLAEMERDRLDIGPRGEELLKQIRERRPQWTLRPSDQAGFHIWHEGGVSGVIGNTDRFHGVSDDQLLLEANKQSKDFFAADDWQALCASDPDRAVRGLCVVAERGEWLVDRWRPVLWSTTKTYAEPKTEELIATSLIAWPVDTFDQIAGPAAAWLDEHAVTLQDSLMWRLWDRIENNVMHEPRHD